MDEANHAKPDDGVEPTGHGTSAAHAEPAAGSTEPDSGSTMRSTSTAETDGTGGTSTGRAMGTRKSAAAGSSVAQDGPRDAAVPAAAPTSRGPGRDGRAAVPRPGPARAGRPRRPRRDDGDDVPAGR